MTGPYVSRDDALTLIVEQRSNEIISQAAQTSVAMATFRTVPVSTNQLKVNLLESFPQAQWLTATPPADPDIVKKPMTDMAWEFTDLYVEEAACIVAIPENVIDDASVPLWPEIESRVAEAVARLIDQTIFFGTAPAGSVPATFPVGGIVGRASAAGHIYVQGTDDPDEDLAEAWNQTMSLVEADGFDVNQAYSSRALRTGLRGMRDANGAPLYVTDFRGSAATQSVYGVPINYVTNGSWDSTLAQAVVGDANMGVIALRQRLTAKRLTEATVNGFNLAEQDMVALRVKTRLGFGVLVPKGLGQSATPYPFAVLGPKAVTP